MALYPSCLYNRTQEARRHLSITRQTDASYVGYPYHIVDLAVRMRPIVEEIDRARNTNLEISLLKFEPSRFYSTNDKYSNRSKVAIIRILGALIHERYIHIGREEGDEQTVRLDVMSDRGRWIVIFSEFLDGLRSYILPQDEIAIVVCDMIDNYRDLVAKDELKYRTIPPIIGNHDLHWLLWEYATVELDLKRKFMNDIFRTTEVPDQVLAEVRFSANEVGYKNFSLYVGPEEAIGDNVNRKKSVSWAKLSETVRQYMNLKRVRDRA